MPRALPRQVTSPIVAVLARLGVTPNMLTTAQLVGGIIAGYVTATGHLVEGGIILIASAFLDAIDGTLARTTGKATPFGAVFDSVIDRLFEGAIFGGILYYYLDRGMKTESMLAFVAMVGSLSVSYVRARAEGAGISLYDGIFTRVVRILFLTLGLVANVLSGVLWLLAVATVLTTLHRLYAVWQRFQEIARLDRLAREPQAGPPRDQELAYIQSNWPALSRGYAGRWIAVEEDRIVAAAESEGEADAAARAAGVSIPFVVFVSAAEELPFVGGSWRQ
jgi:CDP-diacylglycerol--glycerol-3-phosphate 3-phosphatidyltransferase